jgi:hypothetical protein
VPDHGSWMFGGWLAMLLIGVVPLVLLFFALKKFFGKRPPSARELLEQAYTRGELSKDEYCQERDDLPER